MTREELKKLKEDQARVKEGEKLLSKIEKLKAFLQDVNKSKLKIVYTPPGKYELKDLSSLTGEDLVKNRIIGDIILAVRDEIFRLEEEFDKL
jgi:hypothetical protein